MSKKKTLEELLHVVILAGGAGERFWPRSRQARPKQLLPFQSPLSLLEQTYERALRLCPAGQIAVITGEAQLAATRAHLPQVSAEGIVAEPCRRNTAAAVMLAAVRAKAREPQAVLLVLSADHYIPDGEAFARRALDIARLARRQGGLYIFGIRPSRPDTGYGYILRGDPLREGAAQVFAVDRFEEKPDARRAERYVESGSYLWNLGIFCFRVADFEGALQEHLASHHQAFQALEQALGTEAWDETLSDTFNALPSVSLDQGVIEKAEEVRVAVVDFAWDDVGSFEALTRYHQADERHNVRVGDALALDAGGNVLVAQDGGLVAALGVEGLLVVHSPDATLVCRRGEEARLKELLAQMRQRGLERYL